MMSKTRAAVYRGRYTKKPGGRGLKPLFRAAAFAGPTPCDISPLARSMFRVLLHGVAAKIRPGTSPGRFLNPALLFRGCTCRMFRRTQPESLQYSFFDAAETTRE
ncbi:MAG: hypothetical protein LBP69_03195, partial [Treponema sp.]|nr:hypothetical protein [Treponema sp.]